MKTPLKLLAVLGIACAFASSQASLADAFAVVTSATPHEAAAARPFRRAPWASTEPGIFLPDPDAAPSYALADSAGTGQQVTLMAPEDGAGVAPQWRQLIDSLDADGNWRLALSAADQTAAPAIVPDPAGATVPEPAGYLALLAGLAGMALLRRAQLKSITGE